MHDNPKYPTFPQEAKALASPYKICVIDDNDYYISCIKELIEKEGLFAMVLACSSAEDFFDAYRHYSLDGIVLDFELGKGMNGLEMVKKMKRHLLDVPVVSFSAHTFPAYVKPLYEAGVAACLHKSHTQILPEVLQRVIGSKVRRKHSVELTGQDMNLLTLICQPCSIEQIAELLHLSQPAIKKHKQQLAQKLGIPNHDVEFVKWAVKNGYC